MKKLLVLLALFTCACAVWAQTGSVYRGPHTHVGIRPACDDPRECVITVQVSTDKVP